MIEPSSQTDADGHRQRDFVDQQAAGQCIVVDALALLVVQPDRRVPEDHGRDEGLVGVLRGGLGLGLPSSPPPSPSSKSPR